MHEASCGIAWQLISFSHLIANHLRQIYSQNTRNMFCMQLRISEIGLMLICFYRRKVTF